MDARTEARRELVLAAVLLVAVGGIVPPPAALAVAGLAGLAIAAGAITVSGRTDPRAVPPESLIVPAVLAAGSVGAIRLVPTGPAWLPALALLGLGLSLALRLEARLVAGTSSPTESDRARIVTSVVVTAFVAFAGVAALVPGGLGAAGAGLGLPVEGASSGPLGEDAMLTLVALDGLVALLLGYRAAAMRYPSLRDRAWSAATYAIVIAVAAGISRAIDLPRLVGPAVLTLVLYLWDAVHGAAPARRRELRFVWETALLVVLGVVVVAWNLRLRG